MPTSGNNTSPLLSEPLGAAEFAFGFLIGTMRILCEVERDIGGMDHGDPAFDAWFRDAETARAGTISAADAVIMSTTLTPIDRRFRIVARNFEAMLLTHDATTYAFYSEALMTTAWFYHVAGRGPRATRATAMLKQFRHYLGLLQVLPDYTPEPGASMQMAAMAA